MKVLYFIFAIAGTIVTGVYLALVVAAILIFCVLMLIAALVADAWTNAGVKS